MPQPKTRPLELAILTTGGTFEKRYLEMLGGLGFIESCLEGLIKTAKLAYKPRIEEVLLMDSLEMGDKERGLIVDRVHKAKEKRLVIIHGTDTMTVTAKALKEQLGKNTQKTIVFTGAMIPVAHQNSDGFFNLGLAIAACQLTPPGVYIAMSGSVYEADRVEKNRRRNLFLPSG
jgi:L-asparaginase